LGAPAFGSDMRWPSAAVLSATSRQLPAILVASAA
jgi:hypothetical protein